MTKELSHVMLKLHDVRMKSSNVRKKVRELPNVRKELSYVILELHNMRMKLSYVRKNKGIAECDKRIVTCDIEITQCEDETVKCEKQVREPPNVRKRLSHVMLELHNVRMEP